MRALVVAALLAGAATAAPAQGRCGLICDEELDLEGAEAQARLEGWLGAPLPDGSAVEHLIEGGFQDAFVRARLDLDDTGLAAVLAAAGISPEALAPETSALTGSGGEPDWWDWKLRSGVTVAQGRLPLLPNVTVRAAPDPAAPGRWTVWLWAFQT